MLIIMEGSENIMNQESRTIIDHIQRAHADRQKRQTSQTDTVAEQQGSEERSAYGNNTLYLAHSMSQSKVAFTLS